MVKLIHNWVPTYASLCRQGREHSPYCLRCHSQIKTTDHVFQGSDPMATTNHNVLLQIFLQNLVQANMPIHIIVCLEYKLSLVLNLKHTPTYAIASSLPKDQHTILIRAVQHQNIIGWDDVTLVTSATIFFERRLGGL
jgi:hypothetical protein